MASLAEDLIQIPQRETAGARSANRFAYQRSWALCRLLDLHDSRNDYVLLSEFHDDVAILDSPLSPSAIEFFQVKTRKSGRRWTRGQLLVRKKTMAGKRLPSILGKLYANYLAFSSHTAKLAFVSNVPCGLKKADGTNCDDHQSNCLDELQQNDLDHIRAKLAEEHSLSSFPGGENLTFLEVSELSVFGHDVGALGRITDFLHRNFGAAAIRPVALHKTLKSELERRSTRESRPKSIEELASKHGITRAEFSTMLATAAAASSTVDIADRVERRLNTENVPIRETVRLVAAVNKYLVQRRNPTEKLLRDAAAFATEALAHTKSEDLFDILDEVRPVHGDPLWQVERLHGEHYRKAVLAVALHEDDAYDDQVPPIDPHGQDQGS